MKTKTATAIARDAADNKRIAGGIMWRTRRLRERSRRRARLKLCFIGTLVAACALILSGTVAHASQEIIAKITYTGTFGDGHLYVGLDTMINEPGCAMPRFDVPGTHPNIKNFTATALAAAASGRAITVKTNGCFSGYPTLDQANGSYFSIHGQ